MFLVRLKRLRWVCVLCGLLLLFFVVEASRFVLWLRHMGFFVDGFVFVKEKVGLCLWLVLVVRL